MNALVQAAPFISSPMSETLIEKPVAIRAVPREFDGSHFSLATTAEVSAPEPQRTQHAYYRSQIDEVASYNPVE